MYRRKHRLREQAKRRPVRSRKGLRSACRCVFWGRINCQLLSEGRGSGLVREGAGTFREYVSPETPSSRTSEASPGPLTRPSARIKS
ncbi:hypothetical protein CXB34_07945 [Pseudomonas amygdali pv. morsprunorum]|nr:hypothetical protein CXB34_07945 [Pseudomonas amygdali pv. morsprunorum]